MPSLSCKFTGPDCEDVLHADDAARLLVMYLRHLEAKHVDFLKERLQKMPLSEILKSTLVSVEQ